MRARRVASCLAVLLLAAPVAPAATLDLGEPVVMRGAAVAETEDGLVGSTATFTISVARNGSGHIFLDTFPLTQVDMQGSARLAARVAAQATGKSLAEHDLFFVIRSGSVQIGGPSAGGTLAVGAIAALNGWRVRSDVVMTGTVSPDGSIGPVGGVAEKAQAAAAAGMTTFLFPSGEEVVPLSSEGDRLVEMASYCQDDLRIECRPVSDVYEAVENMTDHAFVRSPVTANVTGEDFLAKLGPLSAELVAIARERVREAGAEVARVPASEARSLLDGRLDEARILLARAESAASNATYYTASSLSFQASIAGRDARDRARLALSEDVAGTLNAILAEAAIEVDRARGASDAAQVRDTAAFEFVAAAQVRTMEAEARLAAARALAPTDPGSAVATAAFAAERAETARWWLRLGDDVEPGAPIPLSGLQDAARDAITTSTEEILYVEAVLQGRLAGGLTPARAILADAEAALARGYAAAAMLHALEAQVRASNLLLVASFGGNVPEARLEAVRVAAARAIQAARERGVEPLLAQSGYEFALSLDEGIDKLNFLGLARVTANIAGLPGLYGASKPPGETRFQGLPPDLRVAPSWVAAAFAVGLAGGAALGVTAMWGPTRRGPARPPRPVEKLPRQQAWPPAAPPGTPPP